EGFTLLAARLRTPAGELDLVAADDLTLLVVEVKQRATLAAAATALTPRQSARILAGTAWLLATRPDWTRPNTRIDLILFDQAGDARRIRDVLRQMDS
ncbi:YraN family protein, partial [Acidomonas methanolica]